MIDRDPRQVIAELAARIERLEAELEAVRRQLRPTHTTTCDCFLCLDAYGPVDARSG